jgi:hypothetical protein
LLPLIGPVTQPDFTQARRAAASQRSLSDLPQDDVDPKRRAA